jgi:hypothetical protein
VGRGMGRAAHRKAGEPWRGPLAYWATAFAILLVTLWAEPFIDSHLNLKAERNWLFQRLARTPTNPTTAGQARLVILGDEEFWKGDLHHRLPTDRTYIARLVRALDTAGASVIGLDFDLGAPLPAPPSRPGDYRAADSWDGYDRETQDLVMAIDEVAEERKIVLAKTMDGPDNGPFRLLNDVYNPYGICVRLTADGVWENTGTPQFPLKPAARHNISCGYINLMDDPRRIPPAARIVGLQPRLDSLPMAMARARSPSAVPPRDGPPRYGQYVEGDLIADHAVTISASELLKDPVKARDVLQGWPVIVGGAWHQYAYGLGPIIDTHPTPLGAAPGVLLHENLLEAVLARRTYPGLDENSMKVLEAAVGIVAAVFFAAFAGFVRKLLAVTAVVTGLFVLQWAILRLFGFFFEALIPVLALGVHTLIDRLISGADDEALSPAAATLAYFRSVLSALRTGATHARA